MGNTFSKGQQIDQSLQGWKIKERYNKMNVWRNQNNLKQQIQEYPLFFNDEKQFNRDKRIYQMRKNNLNLVSSLHWTQQKQEQFCSSVYKGTIFLQRIPVRLVNVSDLPFPDVLHANKQAIQGFKTLSQQVGFFCVTQQHIGFTVDGVTKVWMNKDFQKTFPSQNSCKQQQMVRQILQIIDENTDRPSFREKPTFFQFLYPYPNQPIDNRRIGFNQALNGLFEYTRIFNQGQIPSYLNCVRRVGTEQLMRQFKENQQNQRKVEQSKNSFDQSSKFPLQNNLAKPIESPIIIRQQLRNNTIIDQVKISQIRAENQHVVNKQNIRFVPILQGLAQYPSSQTEIRSPQSQKNIIASSFNIPVKGQPQRFQQRVLIQKTSQIQDQKNNQHVKFSQFRPSLPNQVKAQSFQRIIYPPLTPINNSQIRQISYSSTRTPTIENVRSAQIVKPLQNNVTPFSNNAKWQVQYKSTTQQAKAQVSNEKTVGPKRAQSLFNYKTTVATSQVIPNNGKFDSDRFKMGFDQIIDQQRNPDYYSNYNRVQAERPIQKREILEYSQKYNNGQVSQISQLSSIGHQMSQKNKQYQSQKLFYEIRGQSINNNSDFQENWQDNGLPKNANNNNETGYNNANNNNYQFIRNNYNQFRQQKNNGQNSSAQKYKDGTSSVQFWNQLNNFKKIDSNGVPKTTFGQQNAAVNNYQYTSSQSKNSYSYTSGKKPEYMAYYQATYGEKKINNNEPYELSSYKKSEVSYNPQPMQNTYSYQQAVQVSTQYQNGNIYNQAEQTQYQISSPPRNFQDISYKTAQSPQHPNVFQAESFGLNNPKGRNLQQNLETKYLVNNNQKQQYKVAWDPEILADLQQIKE